ncbi:MAG: hypothetical protein QGH93_02015 [Gammaproteobacteria bacterium]|jgi:hypothetical protein|nr:hypothetical protein [Chromatiales bacterium]MDP6673614.1 hypothetical protein [Gammaproteobacteria bacterium]
MDEDKNAEIIKLYPDTKNDRSGFTGWDPYIFSIFANRKNPHPEERRCKPRTRDASRRRALLLAQSRRQK